MKLSFYLLVYVKALHSKFLSKQILIYVLTKALKLRYKYLEKKKKLTIHVCKINNYKLMCFQLMWFLIIYTRFFDVVVKFRHTNKCDICIKREMHSYFALNIHTRILEVWIPRVWSDGRAWVPRIIFTRMISARSCPTTTGEMVATARPFSARRSQRIR